MDRILAAIRQRQPGQPAPSHGTTISLCGCEPPDSSLFVLASFNDRYQRQEAVDSSLLLEPELSCEKIHKACRPVMHTDALSTAHPPAADTATHLAYILLGGIHRWLCLLMTSRSTPFFLTFCLCSLILLHLDNLPIVKMNINNPKEFRRRKP